MSVVSVLVIDGVVGSWVMGSGVDGTSALGIAGSGGALNDTGGICGESCGDPTVFCLGIYQ